MYTLSAYTHKSVHTHNTYICKYIHAHIHEDKRNPRTDTYICTCAFNTSCKIRPAILEHLKRKSKFKIQKTNSKSLKDLII